MRRRAGRLREEPPAAMCVFFSKIWRQGQLGGFEAGMDTKRRRPSRSPLTTWGASMNTGKRAKGLPLRVVRALVLAGILIGLLPPARALAQTQVGNYASRAVAGRSVVVTGATGESIRVTPYGDYIVRVQV